MILAKNMQTGQMDLLYIFEAILLAAKMCDAIIAIFESMFQCVGEGVTMRPKVDHIKQNYTCKA